MELNEVFKLRRSTRKYDATKKVSAEQINELMSASALAPSWANKESARYYVVCSEEMVEKFRNECLPPFNTNNTLGAPVYIVTTYVKGQSGFGANGPANSVGDGWGAYDLGLHDAYLLLKATDMGLSTLIMGIRDDAKIKEMLSIPEDEEIMAAISLGYAQGDVPFAPRKSVEDFVKLF